MGEKEIRKRRKSAKRWSRVFTLKRKVADMPFVEEYTSTGNKRGLVETFLQHESSPVPSKQIERGRAFFVMVQRGVDESSLPARAWVYRRKKSNNMVTAGASHMTAEQLAQELKPRGLHVMQKDDVHLLFIDVKHLTSDYGLVLVESVSRNNVSACRAAILGHVARTTALRVVNSTKDFDTFRMEMHLPYLTLRKGRNVPVSLGSSKTQSNTKPWADMAFLDQHVPEVDLMGFSIYAAHATIVVSGWDPFKYTALSFVEPGPDVRPFEDEQDDEFDDDEDLEDADSELLPEDIEDKFATYGWQDFHRVNDRSLDPRVRFLQTVQIKIKVAFQEYDYLVDYLSHTVDWIEISLFSNMSTSDTSDNGNSLSQVKLSEYVHRMTNILVKLREFLAEINRAWSKFSGKHGDIAYFSDLADRLADEAISNMRDDFESLIGLEQKICSMEKSCQILAKKLDTTRSQESNTLTRKAMESSFKAVKLSKRATDIAAVTFKAAADTSHINHMSVYLVLATTPFIIALQYFTSDKPLFPFERNIRTFIYSILILIPLLFVCALALYGFDKYKWELIWKLYAALGRKRRKPQKNLSEITAEILKHNYAPEPSAAVEYPETVV